MTTVSDDGNGRLTGTDDNGKDVSYEPSDRGDLTRRIDSDGYDVLEDNDGWGIAHISGDKD